MSATQANATIIEIRGEAVGIVARTATGFAFYAATGPFYALENRQFRSARHAEKAALALLTARSAKAARPFAATL